MHITFNFASFICQKRIIFKRSEGRRVGSTTTPFYELITASDIFRYFTFNKAIPFFFMKSFQYLKLQLLPLSFEIFTSTAVLAGNRRGSA